MHNINYSIRMRNMGNEYPTNDKIKINAKSNGKKNYTDKTKRQNTTP